MHFAGTATVGKCSCDVSGTGLGNFQTIFRAGACLVTCHFALTTLRITRNQQSSGM